MISQRCVRQKLVELATRKKSPVVAPALANTTGPQRAAQLEHFSGRTAVEQAAM